jgi:hypothetical protein
LSEINPVLVFESAFFFRRIRKPLNVACRSQLAVLSKSRATGLSRFSRDSGELNYAMFLKNANFKLEIRHELNGFPEMGGQTDRLEGAQIFSRLYSINFEFRFSMALDCIDKDTQTITE